MVEIPVVDLRLAGAQPEESARLRDACERLGCFRVSGHGVPAALQAEMKAAVRALFDLPDEAKRRNADIIAGSGYVAPSPANPLYEAFGLLDAADPADVDAFCARLDAPPRARETVKSYAEAMHELIVDVAGKVAASLGLEGHPFEDWPCQFRINRYNYTEDTVGSSGVQIHTDSGFLTVLQEDDCVGGLEAWSNGRLHTVKHRVQCVAAVPRISIAMFLLAPKDDRVCAPEAFVDPQHPRRFKAFNYDDYRKLRLSTGERAGEALARMAA
ncbi:unnamed protein product [Triticum turgidum subsp. durum]|uniref:Non-haem dioxygenase N-terminal domain-containing protein n=1 Tax=Triticum turgidum subsp. durum TaxID=4567 RepID=A0A9R1RPI0_TRITD|nr:unnamed protein product [Triticum turgidum subsp. durum]